MTPWLLAAAGFLLGSIPFSWLLVRWWTGKDLAAEGSHNVGAVNARDVSHSRVLGLSALVLDLLKGLAAVLLARAAGAGRAVELASGVASVAGHIFNPWLTWRRGTLAGGKGFAAAAGAFLALAPWLVAVWLAVLVLAWLLFRAARGLTDEAPASAVATLAFPPAAWGLYDPATFWAAVALAILVLGRLRHEVLGLLRRG